MKAFGRWESLQKAEKDSDRRDKSRQRFSQ